MIFQPGHRESYARSRKSSDFQLVRDSVENHTTVNTLMDACDAVFHLAAAVGVQLVLDEPRSNDRTTIHGTEVVLEAANRYVRPVLITSSSEVYGKGTRVPFGEDDDVVMGPTSTTRYCYAYSKGIDEFLGPRVLQAIRTAGDHRAAVQHGWPAADRSIWDGAAAICNCRAEG